MAGLRPPLPLRRLHGPAQPADPTDEGGGAAGPDRVIVTTPLTNTVRTTSTTQRDVTIAHPRGQLANGTRVYASGAGPASCGVFVNPQPNAETKFTGSLDAWA